MDTFRFILIFLTLSFFGNNSLLHGQPIPYPDVPTSSDTKVEVKDVESTSNSSSNDTGTQKELVGINNGSKSVVGIGSLDVKIEGKNVIRTLSTQSHSGTGTGIDCTEYPNHCNVLVYEFMKRELPRTKLRSLGSRTIDSASKASSALRQDFVTKVKEGGLWIRLSSGQWLRIDDDVMLIKAVINQLWRKGE